MAQEPELESRREPSLAKWGIAGLDGPGRGLIAGAFNMIAMPEHGAAYAIMAHFIADGLREGARTALVALDNPGRVLSELGQFGFQFEAALEREQLVYLYYKPAFLHSLGLSTDYAAVFDEIRRLAGDIRRLALLNADLMFNLQSQYLATASVSNAVAASGRYDVTVLGCFVPQHTDAHRFLDASCSNLMPLYVAGACLPHLGRRRYRLEPRRCAGLRHGAVVLDLDPGHEPIRVSSYAEIA